MENQPHSQAAAAWQPSRPAEDGVDLVEIFYLLWGQGRQILACLAAGALLALCATRLLVTPLYQAVSSIYNRVGFQQLCGQPQRPADRLPADCGLPGTDGAAAPCWRT